MKLLLDESSLLWACLFAGKDEEHGYAEDKADGKTQWVNSWMFGLDNAVASLRKTLKDFDLQPKDIINVGDGPGGKAFRTKYLATYKDGREKSPAYFDEYNELQKAFRENLRLIGAHSVQQTGMEADDVICFLALHLQPELVTVLTRDQDLLAMCKPGTINVMLKDSVNENTLGDFPFEFIDLYKATVGDSSDNLPGAKGFGPKAFEKVYATFGDQGMRELRRLIQAKKLIELGDDVSSVKELQKLIDYASGVYSSHKCALLYPEFVDEEKLEWVWGFNSTQGEVHPALAEYRQRVVGVDANNYKEIFQHVGFVVEQTGRLAFDIETSTSEQSDDWSELNGDRGKKVFDQFGQELTGFSFTYGLNNQYTIYVAVDHADTENVPMDAVQKLFNHLNDLGTTFIVHNSYFELTVMQRTLGDWLYDVDDTLLLASYIDEEGSNGLKKLSKEYFDYSQATYEETTQGRKMNQLSLKEVEAYGADDTICTAALFNVFHVLTSLEGSFQVYRDVEIGAAYLTAEAFNTGIPIDMKALSDMTKRDAAAKAEQLKTFHRYLIEQGWEGTQYLAATAENYREVGWIKWAANVVGEKSFTTRKRKFDAVILDLEEAGLTLLASLLRDGDLVPLNRYVKSHFKGEPVFNVGSPKQMQNLMYTVMGLPVRLRNKPTDLMREKGMEGTPQTNELAIQTALVYDLGIDESDFGTHKDDDCEMVRALKALSKVKSLETRENLFYNKYPTLPHWKDGLIHASLRQNSTVTRRYSSASPNLQQLPKGKKGDLRRIILPHKKNALVVSLDFNAQELRVIADYGKDPNLCACYVGDHRMDMHSLTAAEMAGMSYEQFKAIYDDEGHPKHSWASALRKKAKTVNFASEYGVAAPKMSHTLMVTEDEAQKYLDAKYRTFAKSEEWKKGVMKEAHERGYVTTKLGARRHLRTALASGGFEAGKAERQAVNFKIQGSCAEMTKLAMGRIFKAKLHDRYDLAFYAPIHDEVVFSIVADDLPEAVCEIHKYMTEQYADMRIPVESSISMGPNFGDQSEMGDGEVTVERVKSFMESVQAKSQEPVVA